MPVNRARKDVPPPRPDLLFTPENDTGYTVFENGAANPFDHRATTFSRVNAWWLADAALLAYWDEGPGAEIWRRAGCASEFRSEGGAQCHLAWTPEFAIVTFRGTQPDQVQDLLDIARFGTKPWAPGGSVHEGFLSQFHQIWPRIETTLRNIAATRQVWFTGHSLGGALATLALDHFGSGQIYTCGSPRVGNVAFTTRFDRRFSGKSFRYVNNVDLVPELPPTGWLLRYWHIEARKFIDEHGGVSDRAASVMDWWRVSAHMEEARQAHGSHDSHADSLPLPLPRLLADHTPRRYAVHAWNDYAGV